MKEYNRQSKNRSAKTKAHILLIELLENHIIFVSSHWWEEHWPLDARETFSFHVECTNVFSYGFLDFEEVYRDDLEELHSFWKKNKQWGPIVWCIKKRGQLPHDDMLEQINMLDIWDLTGMDLKPNEYSDPHKNSKKMIH